MACAGCDVHHTDRGAAGIPGTRDHTVSSIWPRSSSRYLPATGSTAWQRREKIAAGVDPSSGRCDYGDHEQGAQPVAAVAKARCGGRRRRDGSALTARCSSIQPSRRVVAAGYGPDRRPENKARRLTCPVRGNMSTSITMRRPSPGIHWRVTHLESMTQLLVMRMRGAARPRRQAPS